MRQVTIRIVSVILAPTEGLFLQLHLFTPVNAQSLKFTLTAHALYHYVVVRNHNVMYKG